MPKIKVEKGHWLNGTEMDELIYGKGWRSTTTRFLPQNYYCSCCQHEAYKDGYTRDYVWFDWCPYCGADLKD